MPPKKNKEVQKLSYGEFMQDSSYGGSWADEVEDTYASGTQPLPPSERRMGGGGFGGSSFGGGERSYAQRDSFPQRIPDKPPYTAHLGNLSYDATVDTVTDFFASCEVVSVRIVEDREQMRPKGFGYAEFATPEGLQKALDLDGESFQGRTIRVRIADPPKGREGGDSNRDLSDWTRKGPLADLPSRGGDRRPPRDFGEPRAPREGGPVDDGKIRDFGNWERKGPLSPLPPAMERQGSREGSRPRTVQNRDDPARNRRTSPAAWGPSEGRQEGSRPPRRDFSDRPERPERVPTAAEKDMQWRSSMRPDAPAKSPGQSRSGSEAPPSPAPAAAVPASRPKLNLQKRTNKPDSPDVLSPPPASADPKHNPFGAARPIDTAAREREIEEKRVQALKEKKEADEKAKEERRLAKEAAAKEAAEKAEAEASKEAVEEEPKAEETPVEAAAETVDAPEKAAKEGENGSAAEQKIPTRPREPREPRENVQNPKSARAAESGNWRSASSEQKGPRGAPTGPRRGGAGGPRGGRFAEGGRPPRANGGQAAASQATGAGEPSTPTQDEDGWTTVAAPNKSRRGQGRPVA